MLSFVSLILVPLLVQQHQGKPSPFAVRRTGADIPAGRVVAPISPVSPTGRSMAAPLPRQAMVVAPVAPAAPVAAPVTAPVLKMAVATVVPPVNRSQFRAESPVPPAPEPPVAEPAKPAIPPPPDAISPTPVLRTAPNFAAVETGTSKFEALRLLGPPVTSIQMYDDDGTFVESLRYDWKGNWAGTVRLRNGKVAKIDQP